jgi:hypothetical protein
VRVIFDQYEQPENRLTHALAVTLDQDRTSLVQFLKWLGVQGIPKPQTLIVTEQQVPGVLVEDDVCVDAKGLPDAAIFDKVGWTVLFESKVQARVNLEQIERHRQTAKRHGFESPWIVLISVDEQKCDVPNKTIAITWQEVYSWFNRRSAKSFWAMQMVEYMRVFERKMLLQQYQIRGTITVFDGLRFDDSNPYTYREAKRLIRHLGDLLQKRADLRRIGVDPNGSRRPAITGSTDDFVWDFLPLVVARDAMQFTAFPHLTMGIWRNRAVAAVTVPHGFKGGFRKRLLSVGLKGFLALVYELEERLRPITKRSEGAQPAMYITQRRYRTQNSTPVVDARLEADLRTAASQKHSVIRHQPQWIEAVYQVLVNKRSNIQFGVEVRFDYACPTVRSAACADLFADTWVALSPLINFTIAPS